MNAQDVSSDQRRAYWWQAQRNDFGLPDSLYAPLPLALVLILALGVGSSFIGLLPGVDTQTATLSGAGAPWIGLGVLLVSAGVLYGRVLHNGYAPLWMAVIVACAVVIALLINTLALDVLVVEYPDAFIGGLGLGWLFGGLLILAGFLFDGFVLSVLMGVVMGLLLGGLAGLPIGFEAMVLLMFVYGPIGALAGGLAGMLRPLFSRRRR
ncbi:MAG: hypothetical protein KC519_11965 [Anaerolineae bacterium]|nr:hypothetical protein [Anaerolineae bacterium]